MVRSPRGASAPCCRLQPVAEQHALGLEARACRRWRCCPPSTSMARCCATRREAATLLAMSMRGAPQHAAYQRRASPGSATPMPARMREIRRRPIGPGGMRGPARTAGAGGEIAGPPPACDSAAGKAFLNRRAASFLARALSGAAGGRSRGGSGTKRRTAAAAPAAKGRRRRKLILLRRSGCCWPRIGAGLWFSGILPRAARHAARARTTAETADRRRAGLLSTCRRWSPT